MAEEFRCSRAAISKAVKALRASGYLIDAVTNRGYTLREENIILSEPLIRGYLHRKDVRVKVFDETDSTNKAARQLIVAEEASHGSLIVARSQKNGRGRRGRAFYSPKDAGLYISIILKPEKEVKQSTLLTTSAAVAVYKALEKNCGLKADIKWVNDLLYHGRKICGILTEAITDIESGSIEYAITGIGLNIFPPHGGYPGEIENIVGSIYPDEISASALDRNRLIADIVNELLLEAEDLKLSPLYVERNIIPGHAISIIREGEKRHAYAEEICPDGRLRVKEDDGSESLLSYGEVSVIPEG